MPIQSGLPSIIKSLQHRSVTFSAGTSQNDTIAAVNMAKTVIVPRGNTLLTKTAKIVLTTSTNVAITLNAADTGDVTYDVVEFA